MSPNIEAKVFGPFTLISNKLEMDSGNNIPEIYKFYTNTEMRQLIGKFVKMTKWVFGFLNRQKKVFRVL